MLLAAEGTVGLTDFYAKWFVSLLASLPDDQANDTLSQLAGKVDGADWIATWRRDTPVNPGAVLEALQREGARLPAGRASSFEELLGRLSDAAASSESALD